MSFDGLDILQILASIFGDVDAHRNGLSQARATSRAAAPAYGIDVASSHAHLPASSLDLVLKVSTGVSFVLFSFGLDVARGTVVSSDVGVAEQQTWKRKKRSIELSRQVF